MGEGACDVGLGRSIQDFFLHSSSILFKEPEVIENHIGEVEVPSLELQMRSCYPFICSYILRSFALIPLEKQ